MKYFLCTAAFSNFNCYSTTKAKDLIDFPSSLQVFALTPNILVLRAKRNRNKDLTMNIQMGKIFITNWLFVSWHSFMVLSVDELYYNSFITVPTISRNWWMMASLNVFWLDFHIGIMANVNHNFLFFLIGIHPIQGWTATIRHGVTKKKQKKDHRIQKIWLERTYS